MKASAIVRIILWLLVAAMLTGLLASVILIRSGMDFLGGFISPATKYANEKAYTVGGGLVSERIDALEINWVDGSITVESYDGDKVEIAEDDISNRDDMLRYRVADGKLIIQYRKSGGSLLKNWRLKKDITVRIPSDMVPDFMELEISSVSARIDVSDISAYNSVTINNVSGKVNLNHVGANWLEVNTVSGDVKADGRFYHINTDSVSGNVSVVTSEAPKDIECDSVSGDVTVSMPDNSGFEVNFDAVSGDLNSDFDLVKRGSRYIYGDGRAEYEFDSVSGDFTLERIDGTI